MMKYNLHRICLYTLLLFSATGLQDCAKAQTRAAVPPAPPPVHPSSYTKLVWQDEFNVPGLPDPAKWNYDTGFIANNELQYYTCRRAENAQVSDGLLDIVARYDSFQINGHIYPISSARSENGRTERLDLRQN